MARTAARRRGKPAHPLRLRQGYGGPPKPPAKAVVGFRARGTGCSEAARPARARQPAALQRRGRPRWLRSISRPLGGVRAQRTCDRLRARLRRSAVAWAKAERAVARSHSQAPQAQTCPEALRATPTGSAESPAQVPGSALSSVREHGGLPTAGCVCAAMRGHPGERGARTGPPRHRRRADGGRGGRTRVSTPRHFRVIVHPSCD